MCAADIITAANTQSVAVTVAKNTVGVTVDVDGLEVVTGVGDIGTCEVVTVGVEVDVGIEVGIGDAVTIVVRVDDVTARVGVEVGVAVGVGAMYSGAVVYISNC